MLELVIANLLEVVVRLTPSNTSEFLLGDIFEIFDIKKRRFGPRKALVWLVHQLWVCTVSRVPRTIHNAWTACRVRLACSAGLRTPSGVPLDVCVAAITIVPKEVLGGTGSPHLLDASAQHVRGSSELFFGAVTDRRRSRFPAVLSVALHVAAVALAVVLPPIVAVPKVSTPEHRSVVLLVIPKKAFPVDPTEARMRVPLPAKVSADSPTAFRTVGPTGVFASPGPAQKQVALVAEHGVEQSAQLLSVPAPSYTEEAKLLNVTGEVVLKVKLTATGEVHFLQIVSGRLGHGLDEAAIDAVNQIRCRPAFKAGRPVDVIAYIRVIFKLTN